MSTTFETAKVGDRVWCITKGWGEVIGVDAGYGYPLSVKYDSTGYDTFTLGGYSLKTHVMQSLFWDEVVIEAPVKPAPDLEVDAKVIVWNRGVGKTRRHFSHFTHSGKIACFTHGLTSWTAKSTTEWDDWELAE